MADLGEMFGGGGGFGWGIITNAGIILLGVGFLAILGGIIYYFAYKRKAYNIPVEIKITRSDGKLLNAEWGKGFYDLKKGVCWIKRKKKKPVAMKPFDTDKFLQGSQNVLTVQQISPGHYVPVLPQSFLEMVDDKTGETASLAIVKADFSESKSWKNQFERQSKQAYTVMNLLKDYLPYIGIGIILFMNFAGFAILYSKIV